MLTYKQVLDFIRNIAEAHKQVHSYGQGEVHEIDAALEVDRIYPKIWAVPISSTVSGNIVQHDFNLLCMDLVQKNESNEDYVLSDTQMILFDIVRAIKELSGKEYDIVDNPTFTPFTERFTDWVTGWNCTLGIQVLYDDTGCGLPIDSYIIPQPVGTGGSFTSWLTCSNLADCITFSSLEERVTALEENLPSINAFVIPPSVVTVAETEEDPFEIVVNGNENIFTFNWNNVYQSSTATATFVDGVDFDLPAEDLFKIVAIYYRESTDEFYLIEGVESENPTYPINPNPSDSIVVTFLILNNVGDSTPVGELVIPEDITVQIGSRTWGSYNTGDVILAGTPVVTVIERALSLAIPPTYVQPTVTINNVGSLLEPGTAVNANLIGTFTQNDAGALSALRLYKDNVQINSSPTSPYNVAVSFNMPISGNVIFYWRADYAQGACKLNNLGDVDCTGRVEAGTIQSNTRTWINGYPFLQGMNENLLDGSNIYGATGIIKALTTKQNRNVLLNGVNKRIYYAYPSSYGALTQILDQNGFDVTANFTLLVDDVTSTGLAVNYTHEFNIYYSNITTVNSGTYQFKF